MPRQPLCVRLRGRQWRSAGVESLMGQESAHAGRRVDDGANAESAFADGAPEQVDLREDMKLQPDFHVVFAADVARQTDAQDVGHVTGCQHGLDLGLGRVIQCGMFVLHALQ